MPENALPMTAASLATLALRLTGLLLFVLGLWQAVANLLEGWMEFDPTYLGYFLRSQLMRPALSVLFGLFLFLAARRLGNWLSRDL